MREPFRRARLLITTLLVAGILLGALVIITAGFYHHLLGSYVADIEQSMLNGYFVNMYLLGFQVVITYVISLLMWQRIWRRPCDRNVILLLGIWMFFSFLILLSGCGTVWTLFLCADNLEKAAETSLLRGMELYYTCPEWKLLWDGLQFYRQCCGVHDYMDWMKASWMPRDVLQIDVRSGGGLSEQLRLDEEKLVSSNDECGYHHQRTILAPYACCKHPHHTCVQNNMPRYGGIGFPFLNLTQINTQGCLAVFSGSMWNLLYMLSLLVVVIVHVEILLCCLTRCVVWKQDGFECCTNTNLSASDDDAQSVILLQSPENVISACASIERDEAASSHEQARTASGCSGLRSNFTPERSVRKLPAQRSNDRRSRNKSPSAAEPPRASMESPRKTQLQQQQRQNQQHHHHQQGCPCLNRQNDIRFLH